MFLTNKPTFQLFQRATLAEKEVTTLKEQLATTSPTPIQASVPKTNGSLEREGEIYSLEVKPDREEKMEPRSNSNSCRSSPVHQGGLESELAVKEKEVSSSISHTFFLQQLKKPKSLQYKKNISPVECL